MSATGAEKFHQAARQPIKFELLMAARKADGKSLLLRQIVNICPLNSGSKMARKVVSRKAKREEVEAAEAIEKKTKKKKKKAAKKRKSRAKVATPERVRIFWGVYNHTMKRVAKYEFNQKKAAQKRASELSVDGKPHFVQKDKEAIEE